MKQRLQTGNHCRESQQQGLKEGVIARDISLCSSAGGFLCVSPRECCLSTHAVKQHLRTGMLLAVCCMLGVYQFFAGVAVMLDKAANSQYADHE